MPSANADLLNFIAHLKILLALLGATWLVHLINIDGWLNPLFGLRPRTFWGLVCIPTSPFLHSGIRHLKGNAIVFFPLAWFILLQGVHLFYVVTIAVVLLSGFSLWLFGKKLPPHLAYVGASDLIFGYLGFVLVYGITAGSLVALAVAIVAGYFYMILVTGSNRSHSGVLPGSRGAWLSHLFGFIVGAFIAIVLSSMRFN